MTTLANRSAARRTTATEPEDGRSSNTARHPWPQVRAEYAAGASLGSLGRRFGISRQAVSKRAAGEQWQRGPHAEVLATTVTAQRLAEPSSPGDLRLRAGSRSHAGMAEIIGALERGATLKLAAAAARIDRSTLADWLAADVPFAAACEAAQARFVAKQIGRIDAAGERDWRGAAWMAEHHPASAGEHAPQAAASTGPAITLQLVLGPEAAALMAQRAAPAPPTIEHSTGDAE